MDKKFTLRFLPQFEHDLAATRDYVTFTLQNPKAALRLIEDAEKAILKRLENPLGFQPYQSVRKRKHPYYRINVKNFSIFYVVIDDVMEVRRFVYSKRNLPKVL